MALTDLLAELNDDGDTVELPDGRTLRLLVEPDDIDAFEHINGCDAYGRVAWVNDVHRRYYMGHDGHHEPRPDGFTGRAVKLTTMSGDAFWWEPYYDSADGPYTPPSPAERSFMEHLVTFGFKSVGLELRETVSDSRGSKHVVIVDRAWIGGIDTLDLTDGQGTTTEPNGYLRELLGDLVSELGLDDV